MNEGRYCSHYSTGYAGMTKKGYCPLKNFLGTMGLCIHEFMSQIN